MAKDSEEEGWEIRSVGFLVVDPILIVELKRE